MSTCVRSSATTLQPGRVRARNAAWFAIVAVGRKSAASCPSSSAMRRCSSFVVGSARICSSPTSAAAIAASIPAVGFVTVSERRSIIRRSLASGKLCIYVTSVLHKDHESGRGPCRSDTEDHHRAAGQRRARRRRDRHALFDLEARRLPPPACPPGARPRPRGGPAARLLARARPARGAGRLAPPLPRLLGEPPRRPRHGGQARTRTEGEAMKEHGVLRAEGERRGVRFERRFAAPVDEVWDALTSPDRRARWLAHGRIEDTPGGAVRLDFGEGGLVTGRVLSWEPPSLLEFEWRFAGETESVVRFELFADGDGTRLVLDHRALAEEHAAGYSAGWHAYLAALGDHLEGRQGSWDERFASALPQYRESAAGLEEASLP